VLELARSLGMGKLGHVAIDSTRVAANAAADSVDTEQKLRGERAKIRKRIRRWQQQCESEDPNEGAGTVVAAEALQELQRRLGEIPLRLERLKKSGVKRLSRTDQDSRFLRDRRGFTLGYTATVAVSEDHVIVAQQVGQASTDNGLLVPLVEQVGSPGGKRPGQVSADSGFFSNENLQAMEDRGIDAYVPDYNMARVLNRGGRLKQRACHPAHQRMRRKLRSAEGRRRYQKRKELAEPIFGVLKEQRGMRRFRMRGLAKVAIEFTLAATALNLTRIWRLAPHLRDAA
jgi:IS5 family transposase